MSHGSFLGQKQFFARRSASVRRGQLGHADTRRYRTVFARSWHQRFQPDYRRRIALGRDSRSAASALSRRCGRLSRAEARSGQRVRGTIRPRNRCGNHDGAGAAGLGDESGRSLGTVERIDALYLCYRRLAVAGIGDAIAAAQAPADPLRGADGGLDPRAHSVRPALLGRAALPLWPQPSRLFLYGGYGLACEPRENGGQSGVTNEASPAAALDSRSLRKVDRVIGDLRRGAIVIVAGSEECLAVQAAENATEESLAQLSRLGNGPLALALTRRRAAALGLAPAASAPGGTVLLALPPGTEAPFVHKLADPGAAVVGLGIAAPPGDQAADAAVEMMKLARLLPAAAIAIIAPHE